MARPFAGARSSSGFTQSSFWQLLIAAALLVLLGTLATLQYRWLGQVSDAERERLRAGMGARATALAEDFDRELTKIFVTFHVDAQRFEADPGGVLADAYRRAQGALSAPAIIKGLYVLGASVEAPERLQQVDVSRRLLVPAEWPEPLSPLRDGVSGPSQPSERPKFVADTVDSRAPAIVIAMPRLQRLEQNGRAVVLPDPRSFFRVVIVLLDPSVLQHRLLEPLIVKQFGAGEASEYWLTVLRGGTPPQVIYNSDPSGAIDETGADFIGPIFALRADSLRSDTIKEPAATSQARVGKNQLWASITIIRRAQDTRASRVTMFAGADAGWQVRIRSKAGSLETLVARSRRRNLAISLGMLGLLGSSFLLIGAAAKRQQRLARQQMEFVAAVSHELRTPVAVICSAGENLADGLVSDRTQVKQYGTLVETEGRRLADMVERVMDFAGILAGGARRTHARVDMAGVLADVVGCLAPDARLAGVELRLRVEDGLPDVVGDVHGLRSAMENIAGNAIKYSPMGSAVEIQATRHDGLIRICAVDHGTGIDACDLPRVFQPFFRGRRAVDSQVRGTGVGLSVVRHVVDAHHGSIRIHSRPGEGTTVVVDLPIAEMRDVVATQVSHAS